MNEPWTGKDAKFLARFLKSDTGQKLKSLFDASKPKITGRDFTERAIAATEYGQWETDRDLVKRLLSVEDAPEPESPFIDVTKLDVKKDE